MVKVLFLVDDDQDDREIFQEALTLYNPGIQVIFAVDGENALEVLNRQNENPDVIFLDYNMPKMNGLDCLRQLKRDSRSKHIPVIMYTTSTDREQEKVVLLLGADAYLRKTTSFTLLCDELNLILNNIGKRMQNAS